MHNAMKANRWSGGKIANSHFSDWLVLSHPFDKTSNTEVHQPAINTQFSKYEGNYFLNYYSLLYFGKAHGPQFLVKVKDIAST